MLIAQRESSQVASVVHTHSSFPAAKIKSDEGWDPSKVPGAQFDIPAPRVPLQPLVSLHGANKAFWGNQTCCRIVAVTYLECGEVRPAGKVFVRQLSSSSLGGVGLVVLNNRIVGRVRFVTPNGCRCEERMERVRLF